MHSCSYMMLDHISTCGDYAHCREPVVSLITKDSIATYACRMHLAQIQQGLAKDVVHHSCPAAPLEIVTELCSACGHPTTESGYEIKCTKH